MRGISDPSQRDVIPIGVVLKRTIAKTYRVGVLLMDNDDSGDINEILDVVGLKSISISWTLGPSNWFGRSTSVASQGFLEQHRIGNEIRVRGIEVALGVQLVSEEGGTMTETSPTTWTNTSAMNGACKFRLMLLVNYRYPKGDGSAAEQIMQYPSEVSSLMEKSKIDTDYSIIFDKSYVLQAEGDQIIDHIFIDCDFSQYYREDSDYPYQNDLEFWYFLDSGEFSDPAAQLYIRRWFYDN